ncbi:hypothetical protein ACVBE9_07575 [Eionea flava]
MADYLTGMGHFGISFMAGYCLFLLLLLICSRVLTVRLYSPFLPFLLGFLGAAPYFFIDRFTCELPVWLNAFFFYSQLHCQPFAVQWLGNIHAVVLACGLLYIIIILYYIHTVKQLRRRGFKQVRVKKRRRSHA